MPEFTPARIQARDVIALTFGIHHGAAEKQVLDMTEAEAVEVVAAQFEPLPEGSPLDASRTTVPRSMQIATIKRIIAVASDRRSAEAAKVAGDEVANTNLRRRATAIVQAARVVDAVQAILFVNHLSHEEQSALISASTLGVDTAESAVRACEGKYGPVVPPVVNEEKKPETAPQNPADAKQVNVSVNPEKSLPAADEKTTTAGKESEPQNVSSAITAPATGGTPATTTGESAAPPQSAK